MFRPQSLDEIVGMETNKKILYYDINGSLELGQPIPSYIISGPSGTGKTTLAMIIADMAKSQVYRYMGTEIKSIDTLRDIGEQCEDLDIIYIEEAHSLNKSIQTAMLDWIENFLFPNGECAPKVTFILPTTNPGKLLKPLRERCKQLHVSIYSVDEIKRILINAASKINIDLESDEAALDLLARCSRGIPRIAVSNRLDSLHKLITIDRVPYNMDTVKNMLETQGINEWGLESSDLIYLETLYDKIRSGRRPVSKQNLCSSTGFDIDNIEEIIERYLLQINAIRIDPRGRMITNFGCEILNKTNPLVNLRSLTSE